jgi:hypothetical protein
MELFEILERCDFFILDLYLFFYYISSGFNGTRLRSIKLCFMVYIML